jgi:hypothetical protein
MTDVPSFYVEQLLPTYNDWRSDPTQHHRANALAQAANNMAERFAHHYGFASRTRPRRPTDYRARLRQDCPEFGLIWALAEGTKHVFLDRVGADIKHINQVEMSKKMDDWGKLSEVKSFDKHQVLVVTDNNGARHRFQDLIEVVMPKFRELMAKEGIRV